MTFDHIALSEPASFVLQVTLNRPRQFNALARTTFQELLSAMEHFEQSDHRVLILTGAGRAFCFGADFQEFRDPEALPELLEIFQNLIRRIYNCPRITIASLNGFATGAGLDLALACDFRIAAERVKLGEAYIGMGLVPDGGGSFFLPRVVGAARALQLLMTGESIEATEAKALGIVNSICAAEQLAADTLKLAQSLAAKPQTALRLIKTLVRKNMQGDLDSALRNECEAQLQCMKDPEHLALVHDFLAKRK